MAAVPLFFIMQQDPPCGGSCCIEGWESINKVRKHFNEHPSGAVFIIIRVLLYMSNRKPGILFFILLYNSIFCLYN